MSKLAHVEEKELKQVGAKEWLGLAILALPTLLLSMDASILFLAVPHLVSALQATSIQQLWIMDIYAFLLAGCLVTMGSIGDRIGRRRLLLIGGAAFAIVSILAAFATSAEMLIVARALLGVAGATLMPSTMSLISVMFPIAKQRSLAIGIWMTCFSVGGAIGPSVGGLLIESFWWGSVFLIAVPIMLLLLVLGPILLPEYKNETPERLDIMSVILSLATLLPIIFGIKQLAKGELLGWAIGAILGGLFIGFLFVRRQRALTDPLFDLKLFRIPAFRTSLGIMLFGMMAMGGSYLTISQYLQLIEDMSPLTAGLWMIPMTLGMVAGSLLAPFFVRRVSLKVMISVGLLIGGLGFVFFTQVASASGFIYLITGSIIAFFGLNITMMLTYDTVISSVPQERVGAASSLSETSGEMGVALGVAIFGSISTAIYRNQMKDALPSFMPAGVSQASQDTLAGATQVLEKWSHPQALELLNAAHTAFIDGMQVVSIIALVVVTLLALVSFRILRKSP